MTGSRVVSFEAAKEIRDAEVAAFEAEVARLLGTQGVWPEDVAEWAKGSMTRFGRGTSATVACQRIMRERGWLGPSSPGDPL